MLTHGKTIVRVLFSDCLISYRFSTAPGGAKMKKVIFVVLIMVLMLAFAATAFADPTNPPHNDNGPYGGSCNMGHSWWEEGPPGEGNGVEDGESGMHNVHQGENPHHGQQGPLTGDTHDENGVWYPNGATNMDTVTDAQCGPE
jgi:hypothetical protein